MSLNVQFATVSSNLSQKNSDSDKNDLLATSTDLMALTCDTKYSSTSTATKNFALQAKQVGPIKFTA